MVIRAVNTAAEDPENPIHDDCVAAQFGFRGGLVPGVTVYAYMAAAVTDHFGPSWLECGAMDFRFYQPVYDGDEVGITLEPEADGRMRVQAGDHASGMAWLHHDTAPVAAPASAILADPKIPSAETLAPATVLGTLDWPLDLHHVTITAPLSPVLHGVAQPAALLALANEIFKRNYRLEPWIHAASEVRKFQTARDGDPLRVFGRVADRFERKGHQFVALDVDIVGPRGPVEHIRQTAIWRIRARS